MKVKAYAVTVSFRTHDNVAVQRTITITDTQRSNAVARALRAGVPANAKDVALVSAK